MDYAWVVLGMSIPVLLAGCDADRTGEEQAAQVSGSEDAPIVSNAVAASATVGPIRYQYDATALTMTEVVVEVPPDYRGQIWGAKLIPRERGAMLGQELCRYGQSGRVETCEAEKEAGVVLALLERPLADYRQAFVNDGLGDELSPVRMEGALGFAFTAEAEGSGIEYRFLPLQGRTVLLARQFTAGQDGGEEAMEGVISSVSRALEAAGA